MYKIDQSYIDRGVKDTETSGPIALCLREQIDDEVRVGRGYVFCPISLNQYAKDYKIQLYKVSDALRAWIYAFDLLEEVPEIEIEVRYDKFYIKGEHDEP